MELQVSKDQVGLRVPLGHQAHLVIQDFKDQLVPQGSKVRWDFKVLTAIRVQLGSQVLQEEQDHKDLGDHKDNQGHLVLMELQDSKVNLELLV